VTEDAEAHLANADKALEIGRYLMSTGYVLHAGREAYFALFRSALGIVFAHGRRPPRTHKGAHFVFHETAEQLGLDSVYSRLLTQTYKFKQSADYGPGLDVEAADIETALAKAAELTEILRKLLAR
jgi:uncharacterized protein (UPF0332 family)